MALKASGAYRHCGKPCNGSSKDPQRSRFVDSDSDRFQYSYKRAGDHQSLSSTPGFVLRGFSSGDGTPNSEEATVGTGAEAEEAKEWVAQVEPGVLITFVSVGDGGNDLKRIRFRY